MKTRRLLLPGLAVSCCAASFIWYTTVSGTITTNSDMDVAPSAARPVPTTIVNEAEQGEIRMFPGTVKARKSADIAFSIDGLLVELNGQEGRQVKEGEVLARIDQRDFKNSYEASRASYLRAKADFRRTKTLFDRQVISQAEYDTSKANHDVALAEMNIRKKALDDTVITAPYDAVIADRFVENNEHIKKQAAILSLHDISEIEVVIQVPERLMAHGAIEGFKDIWVKFESDASRWFKAAIREYRVNSDPMTRTYEVAVRLPSPEGLAILPGMTATVRTVVEEQDMEGIFTIGQSIIPVESVFTDSTGASFAWVIPDSNGTPVKQPIRLGAISEKGIAVLEGLEPGTRIATAGVNTLSESMKVRPMKEGGEGLDG